MIRGQCLCGAHRFAALGPFELNHHCHCGYCRKHHGSAYVSLVGVAPERFSWEAGEKIAYASSPGFTRESCATCGTALPSHPGGLPWFVPAGCLDDLEVKMGAHIFVGSKLEWLEIRDGLPTFAGYPPGTPEPGLATKQSLDPAERGCRGSCLCGEVRFVISGPTLAARHCHCTRCRRARAAAHASNLVAPLGSVQITAGESRIRDFKLPGARYFTQCFCERCGAKVPRLDPEREIAVVPLGGLDDAAPLAPQEHIFTADAPPWSTIHDDLPQHPGPSPD